MELKTLKDLSKPICKRSEIEILPYQRLEEPKVEDKQNLQRLLWEENKRIVEDAIQVSAEKLQEAEELARRFQLSLSRRRHRERMKRAAMQRMQLADLLKEVNALPIVRSTNSQIKLEM